MIDFYFIKLFPTNFINFKNIFEFNFFEFNILEFNFFEFIFFFNINLKN